MKDKKSALKLAAIVASTLAAILCASFFIVAYNATKYLPLVLLAFVLLMPAAVNASVLITAIKGDAEAIKAPEVRGKLPVRILRRIARIFMLAIRAVVRVFLKLKTIVAVVLAVLAIALSHTFFWQLTPRMTSNYKLSYVTPVVLAGIFILFVALEKWCAHIADAKDDFLDKMLKNVRSYLTAARLATVITAAVAVIGLLGLYELQQYAVYAADAIFCYETFFTVASLIVRLIKRELSVSPDLCIPALFSIGGKDLSVIAYLEENTGITMRSLWSIKLIKNLIPFTLVGGALLLWLCTGIVQIEPYQRGAVYRFGVLEDNILEPGLHLTLPWPFARTEIYDTEVVERLTVGYVSSENSDNTWTGSHGSQEYRLLLGGGNELVSVNLRIEYRISDLGAYLRSSASPERILEAKAYELATDKIIVTDLDSLLAIDRSEFATAFEAELTEILSGYNVGLEVVDIVLESIHPPVEIASVYQELIGAQIDAEKIRLNAEASAAVKIAEAEKQRDTEVLGATAESLTKRADALSSVAEFMASVAADGSYSDAYRYYKYMKAVAGAYGNSKLVIVGDGIDSSGIYFVPGSTLNKTDSD